MRSAFVKDPVPPSAPAAAASVQQRKSGRGARIALHLSLGLTFATAGAAFMIWPQWMEMDGAKTALEIQQGRERELNDRLETVRSMQGRLRSWDQEARRVLLPEELSGYNGLVQAVAQREGAQVLGVKVTQRPSPRWRSLSLHAASVVDEEGGAAGEVQPRAVRVVLTGSFNSVYRSISSLCEQQLLFIPDRWTLGPAPVAPAAGSLRPAALGVAAPAGAGERQLRAEIWATVFVVQDPEEKPKAPVNSGPIAANLPADVSLEGVQ